MPASTCQIYHGLADEQPDSGDHPETRRLSPGTTRFCFVKPSHHGFAALGGIHPAAAHHGVKKTVPIPLKAILSEVPDRVNGVANVTDGEAGACSKPEDFPCARLVFQHLLKTFDIF